MKIAYISYEHPKGILSGGIGTYIGQISRLMASRGHQVEVFCSGIEEISLPTDGYLWHSIICEDKNLFRKAVLPIFTQRHQQIGFDIVESPEFSADALHIKETFPDLPLVVKLHTPGFLVSRLNSTVTLFGKLRFILGGLLKGRLNKPFWHYNYKDDMEYKMANIADHLSSPSTSLRKIIASEWKISSDKINVLPYPFTASPELLGVGIAATTEINVLFVGRLEKRKGILDLMEAIPEVLEKMANVQFYFAGADHLSPVVGQSMQAYIKQKLKKYESNFHFMGVLKSSEIVKAYELATLCIFPSLWENFPNVCLEAMSAGKVVIGSNSGGMADIIDHDKNGYLIPAQSHKAISTAIISLVSDRKKMQIIGKAARQHILKTYNAEKVGNLTEVFFKQVISNQRNA